MDERLRFVARLLEGEKMAVLCREFDISRKTGYKIFQRYKDCGVEGLTDRSRRPYRHANKLPAQLETRIVELRKERPSWGAPKIRERLKRLYGNDIQLPAISTVHAVLDRHGLVSRGRKRRPRLEGTPLSRPLQPNDLWCADCKGEFMLANCGRICLARRRKINLSTVLAGQNVGIKQVSTSTSGSSPSCSTIWDSSMMRHAASSRALTRSRRRCYLCLRYKPSPM